MNEIEKMMQNAGIKRTKGDCLFCPLDVHTCERSYKKCPYYYPPFTAEKQLKILCFIVNNKHSVTFHDQIFGGDKLTLEKIQENLAWAINRIWQDLTEKEKQQIKEILE